MPGDVTRVVVCGSRHWTDYNYILDALKLYRPKVVVEGGAPGADLLARKAALELGMEVEQFDADWKHKGPSAGPERNTEMLTTGHPDLVLVFSDEMGPGTSDTVNKALFAGIPFLVFQHVTLRTGEVV